METTQQEYRKCDEPLLYYEIHDELDRKRTHSKIFFLLLVSIAFGMGLIFIFRDNQNNNQVLTTAIHEMEVGEIPSNTDEVMQDREKSDSSQKIQAFGQDLDEWDLEEEEEEGLVKQMKIEWDELEIILKNTTSDVVGPLEKDVFHRLDLDGDDTLSKEELSRFFTSAMMKSLQDLTPEDMPTLKDYIRYPIYRITDDMSDQQIQKICFRVAILKSIDFEERIKEFGNDPSLLIKRSLEMVDQSHIPYESMNYEEFHSFLGEAEHSEEKLSRELHIPDQCTNSLDVRRRAFLFELGQLFVCGIGSAGAAAGNDAHCRLKNKKAGSSGGHVGDDGICRGPCGAKRRERRRRLPRCSRAGNTRVAAKTMNTCMGIEG